MPERGPTLVNVEVYLKDETIRKFSEVSGVDVDEGVLIIKLLRAGRAYYWPLENVESWEVSGIS
jgi:hypothetical protein